MSFDYLARSATDGLTLNLYRGEDMVLLAFDIDDILKKPDFVGFGIQYFIGNATQLCDVFNFLTFKRVRLAAKAAKKEIDLADRTSMRAPIQQFRWAHVPSVPIDDVVTYQVLAMFFKRQQSANCQSNHAGVDQCPPRHARYVPQCRVHARLRQLAGL